MKEKLNKLISIVGQLDKYPKFKALLTEGSSEVVAIKSVRPALIAAAFSDLNRSMLIIVKDEDEAEYLGRSIKSYLGGEDDLLFPDYDTEPYEDMRPNTEHIGERFRLFKRIGTSKSLVIASIRSVLRKVPTKRHEIEDPIILKLGDELATDGLLARLIEYGYERVQTVEGRGEIAGRGSIVDIFPSTGLQPVRIDFFGDTIESLRIFSVDDQLSIGRLEEIEVMAVSEYKVDDKIQEAARDFLATSNTSLEEDTGNSPVGRIMPALFKMGSLIEHFIEPPLIVISEGNSVMGEALDYLKMQDQAVSKVFTGGALSSSDYFLSIKEIENIYEEASTFEELIGERADLIIEANYPPESAGRIDVLKKHVQEFKDNGYSVVMALPDSGEYDRLCQLMDDFSISRSDDSISPSEPFITVGSIDQGFVIPELRLAVLGESDIFPRHLAPQQLSYVSRKKALLDFTGLMDGDFLVHEMHGISRFKGLVTRKVDEIEREYLILEYAAGDRLFLPTDQLHKVSRFIGPDSNEPKITRLGSSDWIKSKKKAKSSVDRLAIDLKKLYMERLKSKGYMFSIDSEWQRELEGAFPYTETRDQQSAIDDVKKDMESSMPMDRLVCGDVGYGKTEIAIRAAFKTILDSKQVMMVAPTTILAQQHYISFKERFAPYPIKVEMLSRFRTPKQRREIVEKVRIGKIDFVVGTHRLLQKDVDFSDLGLVIIDEEQRFGVGHKEHIRALKRSVDVLTLSATPIPRTLQMSLSGVRDLSIIDTPPEGRRPVITYVGEYLKATIKGAIERELARGGQVFFLHNRVENIDKIAVRLRGYVPNAKILIGHGQMSEVELEKVMVDFMEKKADILICTTIIESGLDIPNANTLIVEDADNLGLAQLYQLRGRVGRAHHQAFAYLTYKSGKNLSGTALERLKSIAKFTELGSGFKIALRDLEIRGAGNILGAEQHGQMSAVGFELYCQLLKEAVDELEGKPMEDGDECQIDLSLNITIPTGYIEDNNLRLDIYRSISSCRNEKELNLEREGLLDRFGKLPKSVRDLFSVTRVRMMAKKANISAITFRNGRVSIKGIDSDRAKIIITFIKGDLRVSYKERLSEISVKGDFPGNSVLTFLLNLISDIIPQVKRDAT